MSPTTAKAKPARSGAAAKKAAPVFSDDELAAIKDARTERKKGAAAGEADLLAKLAELSGLDRQLAEKLHAIVKANAPGLMPKTWYGMPAYCNADGKVVCFFTPAGKFKSRYATFGFNEAARLDDGAMWPTSFALTAMSAAEEKKLAALVRKAVG